MKNFVFFSLVLILAVCLLFSEKYVDNESHVMLVEFKSDLTTSGKNKVSVQQEVSHHSDDLKEPIKIGDYYDFALSILDDAKAGDPSSQYKLANIIEKCGFLMESRALLEDKLSLFLATLNRESDTKYVQSIMEDIVNCSNFESTYLNVFSDDNIPTWRNLASYWYTRSALSGNHQAATQILFMGVTFADLTLREKIINQIYTAITAGNAESMFYYGASIQSDSESQIEGVGWMLYACNTGYVCDYRNSDNMRHVPLIQCVVTTNSYNDNDCEQHLTINSYLKHIIPRKTYQQATEIADAIQQSSPKLNFNSYGIKQRLDKILTPP